MKTILTKNLKKLGAGRGRLFSPPSIWCESDAPMVWHMNPLVYGPQNHFALVPHRLVADYQPSLPNDNQHKCSSAIRTVFRRDNSLKAHGLSCTERQSVRNNMSPRPV